MIVSSFTGTRIDSESIPVTGTTKIYPDMIATEQYRGYFRLGGTLCIAVGCAVAIDGGEGTQGGGATFTALTASGQIGLFGRQVVATAGGTAEAATMNAWCGAYTGRTGGSIGGQPKGYNYVTASTTPTVAIASLVPSNALTYSNATTTIVQGDYAVPGEIVEVAMYGPAVVLANDAVASSAGHALGPMSSTTPVAGQLTRIVTSANVFVAATSAGAVTTALDVYFPCKCVAMENPTVAVSTPAGLGVRAHLFCM